MALGTGTKLGIGGLALAVVAAVGMGLAERPVGPPIATVYLTPT